MDRAELEGLDRERLVARAEAAGVRRARILTRPEIVDELLRIDPRADEATVRRARGFFGRARDLLNKVVERGLHLPDALDRIRSTGPLPPTVPRTDVQALPTVTLAEIYAAQGHKERAVETLRRVLDREPDHDAARALLSRLEDKAYVAPPPPLPPEPEVEPEPEPELESEPEPAADLEMTRILPECVAVPLADGGVFVWWQGAPPAERFVVRLAVITPRWDGPVTEIRDVDADAVVGEVVVRGLPEGAVVRAAIGTLDDGRFTALACSPALELSSPKHALVRWTLGGAVSVADDPLIARALDAARRA